MSNKEIVEMLTHLYEVDINNCAMNDTLWIDEVAKALTDPEYLNKLKVEHKEYVETLNA